ncbi:MAG: T9SS type A sorting domain-containing protein [Bacteroidota bacterium]|nr:T9SS type A sorting domain-containing protein [Bacteroidota bacterium]
MRHIAHAVLVILLAIFVLPEIVSAQQQGVPVDGKDFYVGYVYPSFNKNPQQPGRDFHGYFGVYVLISSYEDNNQVKISYFDGSGTEIQSVSKIVGARNAIQVPLDRTSMQMTEPGDIPEFKACHITSKKPVNVQYFSTGACSGGSYLSIPTPALGKNYVVPSYYDNPGTGAALSTQAENSSGFFLIIAAFDGTNVTITPNETTTGGHIGAHSGAGANGSPRPYSVQLRRGQCYWVKGDGTDNGNDMSGSIVTADKPIAVLGGHENAFFGDAGARVLEGRDFMVEQVIPSEYWDSTGYVSMPLKDGAGTQGGDPGYGENYRVYTDDPRGASVVMSDCNVAENAMTTARLADPTPENNTGCPVEFHTKDGHKFGVMMYDLRDQGTGGPPHPCESMMSIVPMSRWRTSFLFYVPANTFEILQNYYINIIAERNDIDKGYIKYSFNGSSTLNRLTGLGSQGSYKQIPNHPELEGARFSVSPGAYYFTNTRPDSLIPDPLVPVDTMLRGSFMMYHYGMRAIDPDHDLGDFCGDDFFFSYALPIGMTVSAGGGDPHVQVDTLCSSWHICVTDTGDITIRSVTLLDDPNGNYYRPGKQYVNVHFDPALDPDDKKEIDFTGDNKKECFDVIVSNPLDTAYAPLYIVDSKGSHVVVEMRYKAPSITLTKLQDHPANLDTLLFPIMAVGTQMCDTLIYINTAAKGGKAFSVSSADLIKHDPHVSLGWTSPTLPANLQAGDTLKVQVCFDAKDTVLGNDSVILKTDCFKAPLPVVGKGGTPLIYATDIDFGNVSVNSTSCLPLTVENRGNLPFLLTKQYLLHDKNLFSIDPASDAKLPILIPPGRAVTLTFCYSPKSVDAGDSTSVDWNTNIAEPYTDQIKSWSFLRGKPVKPGVVWDRLTQLDSVICDDSVVVRVYLLNSSNRKTTVTSVFFDGKDAAQYHILANQLGKSPLGNFSLDIKDTIWVDIVFKADLSLGYADRHARIVAAYEGVNESDSTAIDLTGKVLHAVLVNNPTTLDLGFITRGVATSGFVTIINTGDAPYVIKNADFPNPPIKGILLNGKPLAPGDTIFRGDTISLEINVQLDSFTDTTVEYHLNSDKICSTDTGRVHMAASNLKVLSTDFPAPPTFVGGCKLFDSTVTATNLGSVQVNLESIDIISTPATPNAGEFDLIDATGNLVKTYTFPGTGKVLNHLQSVSVGMRYHPTIQGPVSATIRYNWDSAGVKFTTTNIATGNGVQLNTTLSAVQPSGQPYTATTQSTFTVPISLANTPLPLTADVKRVTFRLTYRRDVVDYDPVNRPATPGAGYQFVTPPVVNELPSGDETIDFNVSNPNAVFSKLEPITQVNFEAVVSKELITPFVISNITFFDSKNQSVCYVIADTLPGVYVPQYLCGDTTLHNFLNNKMPTRISMLTPSIVGEDESPVLYYSVNRNDVPIKVEIFNVLGERVRTIKNSMGQAVGNYKLPVGTIGMQSGTYTVRLTTPSSSETVNFIIQK